jgi:hypothetical protein
MLPAGHVPASKACLSISNAAYSTTGLLSSTEARSSSAVRKEPYDIHALRLDCWERRAGPRGAPARPQRSEATIPEDAAHSEHPLDSSSGIPTCRAAAETAVRGYPDNRGTHTGHLARARDRVALRRSTAGELRRCANCGSVSASSTEGREYVVQGSDPIACPSSASTCSTLRTGPCRSSFGASRRGRLGVTATPVSAVEKCTTAAARSRARRLYARAGMRPDIGLAEDVRRRRLASSSVTR